MTFTTLYRRLDPNNPVRTIARRLRTAVVRMTTSNDANFDSSESNKDRSSHATTPNLQTELESARKQIADAQRELQQARLDMGLVKSLLHDSCYWIRLYRLRYETLAAETWGAAPPISSPPTEPPPDMLDGFTMGGKVPLELLCPQCEGTGKRGEDRCPCCVGVAPAAFKASMPGRIWADESRPAQWPLIYTEQEIEKYLNMVAQRQWSIYGMTDYWLWDAFEKYPIRNLDVAVMGSTTPWYEASCIHYGGRPTTIEYNTIRVKSDRMKAITVAEQAALDIKLDAAVSISSFEHDGLGRYGDPIDPDGDIKAMRNLKKIIRPGGLVYLSVPVGKDRVLFNVARVYGEARLPKLIEGWEEVDRFGFHSGILEGNGSVQPILVLRNRG